MSVASDLDRIRHMRPLGIDPSPIPLAMTPHLRTSEADAPVELYAGAIHSDGSGEQHTGEGTLRVVWTPYPTLRFDVDGWEGLSLFGTPDVSNFRIEESSEPFECRINRVSQRVRGRFHGRCQLQAPRPLSRVLFHLTNWPRLMGVGVAWEAGAEIVVGRAVFETDEWRVFLDPVRELDRLVQGLDDGGAFAITYVGQVERVDGGTFESNAADDLLEALRFFLSFARGIWTPPLFPSAFAPDGSLVHKDWELRDASSWRFVRSWFTDRDPLMLQRLFPGFMRLWKNPKWAEALRRSIWWYIAANTQAGGCDGAVILAQAALELLSWVVYVEDGEIVSRDGFDALRTADKLRLLVNWLKVDQHTPPSLTALVKFGKDAKKQKIPYGAFKFVEVRNALVHPKDRDSVDGNADAVIEAWRLGMWYVELAILRACEYGGPYSNRLTAHFAGEVESVPWGSWQPPAH